MLQAAGNLIDRDHEHEAEEELEPRRRASPSSSLLDHL